MITTTDRIVLGAAVSHHALRRTARGYKPVRPIHGHNLRDGVSLFVRLAAMEAFVARGLLAWVNAARSAAVITDAGRAALAGDAR